MTSDASRAPVRAAGRVPGPAAAGPVVEAPVREGAVPRSELAAWAARFGLVAGITERGGEVPPFSLGLRSPESADLITGRLRRLREAVQPRFTAFQMAHQCHGNRVVRHRGVAPGFHLLDDADGHVTAQPGLLLGVSVADCVPVYLTRDDGSAVALLHAGWRGAAAGMLEAGIAALTAAEDGLPACPAGRLTAHLGVAICGACYEVGPEVVAAVEGRAVAGATRFDLRAALARRAAAAGVTDVSISPFCTSCHADRFFSHRASAGDGGRQLAYLGRPAR